MKIKSNDKNLLSNNGKRNKGNKKVTKRKDKEKDDSLSGNVKKTLIWLAVREAFTQLLDLF